MGDYSIDINVNMGSGGDSNFQSLIDAVNNLNATLSKVGQMGQRAGNQTKQSFSESAQIMERFGNSVKKVQAEINSLKNQIIQQNDALRKGIITEAQHKASVDALHASLRQLQTAQRQYNSVLNQTTASAKTASGAFGGLTSAFNKLGAVLGVSFGLYGVFRVLTNIVKTIAEFDLAQKELQAILGETSSGMQELTQSAIDLGRNSIFGAKGVSELQIELAKMGFTKTEVIAMQGAINDLAIATHEDLASSAEVVANIIKVYGMTATETRDVVNVMGKAFNDSALGLSNFREGIKYVAPVAKQAGLSFRETVAAMELLANAGLKGSLTGTALNNVLKAMMDSNSKLAKEMGGAVSGWDGFTKVLQKARDEGYNVQDVFGLITQRATGAFSVLVDGLPTLDEMREKLEDVADVMAHHAGVQLDSITYKAKLLQEQWNATILDMDSGSGILSKLIKKTLEGTSQLLYMIGGDTDKLKDKFVELEQSLTEASNLTGLDERVVKELQRQTREMTDLLAEVDGKNKNQVARRMDVYLREINKSTELLSMTITKAADEEIKKFDLLADSADEFKRKQEAALVSLGLATLDKGKTAFQIKVIEEAIKKLEVLRFERTSKPETDTDTKAIQEKYKYEIELLKIQQSLEEERIKTLAADYEKETLLAENLLEFKLKILDKELERDLALGEDKIKALELYNAKSELLIKEHANKIIVIGNKINKESDDMVQDALKANAKTVEDSVSDTMDFIFNEIDEKLKKNQFMDKWGKGNPILNMLFGKKIRENLLSGLFDEEDVEDLTKGIEVAMDNIGNSLNEYVDSWVDATDRVVDQMNRQVEELQTALQTEIELMEAGYASNVSLRQKELADAKKAREQALKEQRQAQRAQVAIETITQISSLITASAQIIKGFSAIPIIGTGLGIAAVAMMLTAFAAAKSKAMQAAGINKYEHGGWIGGKRHSEGGTLIEAEHGEYMINRKSATKYRDVIEAINNDNKIELNRSYLNNMRDGIVTTRVSLDDSKELRAIRTLLEKKHKQVEYIGEYRIERIGNVTTKIKLN